MEKTVEQRYLQAQELKYAPYSHVSGKNGQLRLKLHSEHGETNWLNITPEQAAAIECILEGK